MFTLKMFWVGGKKFVKVENWNSGKLVAEAKAKELNKSVEVSFSNGVSTGYGLVQPNGTWSD